MTYCAYKEKNNKKHVQYLKIAVLDGQVLPLFIHFNLIFVELVKMQLPKLAN